MMTRKLYHLITLLRPANIITAISDIIAGVAITFTLFNHSSNFFILNFLLLVFSTIGLYGGGIVFNDVFDLKSDMQNRPERILPRGLISKKHAMILGCVMLFLGVIAASLVSVFSGFLAFLIGLLALSYNKITKHNSLFGPINMGLCRGANLLLGMSIINEVVFYYWYFGIIPIVFIAAITLTGKKEICGNNKTAIFIALILDLLVFFLFVIFGYIVGFKLLYLFPFLLFWYAINFYVKYKALIYNEPIYIQKAVKIGVLSLIPLNACYVAGSLGLIYALLVFTLLPVSFFLAKTFSVT